MCVISPQNDGSLQVRLDILFSHYVIEQDFGGLCTSKRELTIFRPIYSMHLKQDTFTRRLNSNIDFWKYTSPLGNHPYVPRLSDPSFPLVHLLSLLRGHMSIHLVLWVIDNPSNFSHDSSSVDVPRNIDGSPESIDEPINGNYDRVHPCHRQVDGVTDHDHQDQGCRWDGSDSDGGEGREEDDNHVLSGGEEDTLSLGQEDDDDREVNCGS